MIAGEDRDYPPFVNETLLYTPWGGRVSHPYQLQTAASLIAQEYAAWVKQRSK